MFEFFDIILGFIQNAWQFFVNFLETLLLAVTTLWQAGSHVILIGALYMPPIIATSCLIVVAIMVIKFLIGR